MDYQHSKSRVLRMLVKKDDLIIRNAIAADAASLGTWWRDGKVEENK